MYISENSYALIMLYMKSVIILLGEQKLDHDTYGYVYIIKRERQNYIIHYITINTIYT